MINFIRESNRIEGILEERDEINVYQWFFGLGEIEVSDLCRFVSVVEPGAVLRERVGMNVSVGGWSAPAGGPWMQTELERILWIRDPFEAYCAYEHLHPFTDGNGRSGRALWMWLMGCDAPLGFLEHFHYQTLQSQN